MVSANSCSSKYPQIIYYSCRLPSSWYMVYLVSVRITMPHTYYVMFFLTFNSFTHNNHAYCCCQDVASLFLLDSLCIVSFPAAFLKTSSFPNVAINVCNYVNMWLLGISSHVSSILSYSYAFSSTSSYSVGAYAFTIAILVGLEFILWVDILLLTALKLTV